MREQLVKAIRGVLRTRAAQLALDPATIRSPSPTSITARTANGELLRVDVATYRPTELSR